MALGCGLWEPFSLFNFLCANLSFCLAKRNDFGVGEDLAAFVADRLTPLLVALAALARTWFVIFNKREIDVVLFGYSQESLSDLRFGPTSSSN